MSRFLLAAWLWLSCQGAFAALITFDRFDTYRGEGLAPGGPPGSLDSTRWQVEGLSDGDSLPGGRHTGGDFARGTSPGGVSSGGLYAFLVDPVAPVPDHALGVQPTASDGTPGAFTLRIVNPLAEIVRGVVVLFEYWFLNDGGRAMSAELQWASDSSPGFSPVIGSALVTPRAADAVASWAVDARRVTVEGMAVRPGETLRLRWAFDEVPGGSGSRDELAIDDVLVLSLEGAPGPARPVPLPAAWLLTLPGLALVGWRARAVARARGGMAWANAPGVPGASPMPALSRPRCASAGSRRPHPWRWRRTRAAVAG